MIKKDIVAYIYEQHGGLAREEVAHYTDLFLELLAEATVQSDKLTVTHFGSFKHKQRTVREVKLPSGEQVLTTPSDRIQFLPSSTLKTRINGQSATQNPIEDTREES